MSLVWQGWMEKQGSFSGHAGTEAHPCGWWENRSCCTAPALPWQCLYVSLPLALEFLSFPSVWSLEMGLVLLPTDHGLCTVWWGWYFFPRPDQVPFTVPCLAVSLKQSLPGSQGCFSSLTISKLWAVLVCLWWACAHISRSLLCPCWWPARQARARALPRQHEAPPASGRRPLY